MTVQATEDRAPTWALAAPFVYLAACAAALRYSALDPSAGVGVPGMLLALGLVPAFVLPAIFGSRAVRLDVTEHGFVVDGRTFKVDEARVTFLARGQGTLNVTLRGGGRRAFVLDLALAHEIVASLPPVSAPAGALTA